MTRKQREDYYLENKKASIQSQIKKIMEKRKVTVTELHKMINTGNLKYGKVSLDKLFKVLNGTNFINEKILILICNSLSLELVIKESKKQT